MDVKKTGKGQAEDQQPNKHFRLTITCRDTKAIEDGKTPNINKSSHRKDYHQCQ